MQYHKLELLKFSNKLQHFISKKKSYCRRFVLFTLLLFDCLQDLIGDALTIGYRSLINIYHLRISFPVMFGAVL